MRVISAYTWLHGASERVSSAITLRSRTCHGLTGGAMLRGTSHARIQGSPITLSSVTTGSAQSAPTPPCSQ